MSWGKRMRFPDDLEKQSGPARQPSAFTNASRKISTEKPSKTLLKKQESRRSPQNREATGQTQTKLSKSINDLRSDINMKPKISIDLCAGYSAQGSKARMSTSCLICKIAGSVRSTDCLKIALVSLSAAISFTPIILCLLMLQIIIQLESFGVGLGGLVPT